MKRSLTTSADSQTGRSTIRTRSIGAREAAVPEERRTLIPSRYARAPWWTVRNLGDLEEADQLEAVQALGAALVWVDLRQLRGGSRSESMRPSMWEKRKHPRTACIIVSTVPVPLRWPDTPHSPLMASMDDLTLRTQCGRRTYPSLRPVTVECLVVVPGVGDEGRCGTADRTRRTHCALRSQAARRPVVEACPVGSRRGGQWLRRVLSVLDAVTSGCGMSGRSQAPTSPMGPPASRYA